MFLSFGASDRNDDADFWYSSLAGAGPTASGQKVTSDRALSLPAVYSCVRVIADSLMQIPLIMYRRLENGGKERATDHPLYSILHDSPNSVQTSPEWREVLQHHILLRGNGYAPIRYAGSRVIGLGAPIHPDLVTPVLGTDPVTGESEVRYHVRADGGDAVFSSADLLHIRGPGAGADGITGQNPIALEREAIGVGLATQDFTARFFANDAQPGGILKHPTNFKNDEQRQKFSKSWQAAHGGANWRKTAILEFGMEYVPTEIKLVDAQFIEQRKYSNLDVARIFRVPPHLIMELDRATFSNITQQDVEFVKFTMLPWFVRWETRLSMSLLNEEEQGEYFFEFLIDGLERGDSDARAKYYKAGVQDGWLTRNEIRIRENMNPLPGLDQPLEQMNMRNPGGDSDERVNEARKENAAVATSKRLRQKIESHLSNKQTIDEQFFSIQSQMVKQKMCFTDDQVFRYCGMAHEQFKEDPDLNVWEKRQYKLLMEIT